MKMACQAEQVEQYEINSLINQNIVKQREKNTKLMEECMFFRIIHRKTLNISCGLIFMKKDYIAGALFSVRACPLD